MDDEKFEQIIKIGRAYDSRPKGGGIGSCQMFIVLKGDLGCVTLAVNTAWFLPCTREWKEMWIERDGLDTWEPRGNAVSYCSPTPLREGQQGREYCDWLGCTCYGDSGFSMADEPFALLLNEGSDAVFDWLKNFYHQTFNK